MSVRGSGTLVLILGTLALGALWWKAARDRDAAHDARVAAEATASALGRIADSIARVRVATTDTFTVERERWRTLTRTDTLLRVHPETVIVRAEAAIAACDRALNACAAEVATLRAGEVSLREALGHAKKEARGCRILGLLPCPVVTAGYGVTVSGDGTVRHGPGVQVGIPLGGR